MKFFDWDSLTANLSSFDLLSHATNKTIRKMIEPEKKCFIQSYIEKVR